MNFPDDGVAGKSVAEHNGNLTSAAAFDPHVTENFDAFVGPGHFDLVYASNANEPREGLF